MHKKNGFLIRECKTAMFSYDIADWTVNSTAYNADYFGTRIKSLHRKNKNRKTFAIQL